MTTRKSNKRGRPSKFDRPSRVVALTLPEDVISGLRRLDTDLAWAVVALFEKRDGSGRSPLAVPPDAELVGIPDGQFLIVVNRRVVRGFSGINVIPLNADRGFLALEPGRGIGDLELAVIDRLEEKDVTTREANALRHLRVQLRRWRRDRTLTFEQRAIIVARRAGDRTGHNRRHR